MNETAVEINAPSENNIAEKYLVFYIENQLFALPGELITEILNMQPITFVPNLAPYIKGIVNIRGKIIPLIDLKIRLGKCETEYNEKTCIILIEIEDIAVGIIVDRVKDVTDIPKNDLRSISSFSEDETLRRFATDICRSNGDTVILLNARNVLHDDIAAV